MNFKKFFAAAAACAVAAFSSVAMTVSAAEVAYTGPSAGALSVDNNGTDVRMNIFNEWGNDVRDINNQVVAEKNILVTFTISGLNGRTSNVDDAGNPTTAYEARLMGQAGSNQFWAEGDSANTAENKPVAITGDGQYTAEVVLSEATGSIECLLLQTNINFYQLAENPADVAASGVNITIDKIEVDADATTAPSTDSTTDNTSSSTTDNTSSSTTDNTSSSTTGGTTNSTTSGATGGSTAGTTSSSSNGAILGSSTQVNSTTTGDAGIAVAVAGLAVAAGVGAAAVALRNKKN